MDKKTIENESEIVMTEKDADFEVLIEAYEDTEDFENNNIKTIFDKNSGENIKVITRENLNSITELTLKPGSATKSLISRIEKLLPNLEVLRIQTATGKNITAQDSKYIKKLTENMSKDEKNEVFCKFFSENQIDDEDFSHIAKLTKLQELYIPSQYNLKKIDISALKDLRVLFANDCVNIKSVCGLNTNILTDCDAKLNFTGCSLLDEQSMKNIVNILKESQNIEGDFSPGHIFLPMDLLFNSKFDKYTSVFCDFSNEFYSDFFVWTQPAKGGVILNHYSLESVKFRNKIKKIISDSCNKNAQPLEQLKGFYKWISDNIVYDTESFQRENKNIDNLEDDDEEEQIFDRPKNYCEKMRSVVTTLNRKKGICVALSDIFRFGAETFDFVKRTYPVSCAEFSDQNTKYTDVCTHQICAIEFTDGTIRYFDPTGDLCVNGKFGYFALTKKEIEKKYNLPYNDLCYAQSEVGKQFE